DLTILIASIHHFGVMGIEQERPYRQTVVRDVEFVPMDPLIHTPVGTALRAYIDDVRMVGMGGNGPDGGGLRQAACDQFTFVITHGHTVQARFDDTARSSLARQAHIHIGRVIRCHSSFLPAGSMPSAKPAVCWLYVFHQKAPSMSMPEVASLSLTLALAF